MGQIAAAFKCCEVEARIGSMTATRRFVLPLITCSTAIGEDDALIATTQTTR
jgi:hypothetical protein